MKLLKKMIFKFCTKILLQYQGMALITGPRLVEFYGSAKEFSVGKNYEHYQLDNVDACVIYRKRGK